MKKSDNWSINQSNEDNNESNEIYNLGTSFGFEGFQRPVRNDASTGFHEGEKLTPRHFQTGNGANPPRLIVKASLIQSSAGLLRGIRQLEFRDILNNKRK